MLYQIGAYSTGNGLKLDSVKFKQIADKLAIKRRINSQVETWETRLKLVSNKFKPDIIKFKLGCWQISNKASSCQVEICNIRLTLYRNKFKPDIVKFKLGCWQISNKASNCQFETCDTRFKLDSNKWRLHGNNDQSLMFYLLFSLMFNLWQRNVNKNIGPWSLLPWSLQIWFWTTVSWGNLYVRDLFGCALFAPKINI